MLPISRLCLPLERMVIAIGLPPEGRLHPVHLDVAGDTPHLLVVPTSATDRPWSCPVAASDWDAVTTAFAPCVDVFGRLRLRSCLAMIGASASNLIIDLMPQPGPRLIARTARDRDGRHRPSGPSPAAAAMMASCLALPAAAATYEVRPGDTLSSIARSRLGPTVGWHEVYRLNRAVIANPHRLVPGTILRLPDPAAMAPAAAAGHQVVVRPGDTLFRLAKRHLGDGKRWPELWAALRHHLSSPTHLPVGLAIPLPDAVAVRTPVSQESAWPPTTEATSSPPPAAAPPAVGRGETAPLADNPVASPIATAADTIPSAETPIATAPPGHAQAAAIVPFPTVTAIERPLASHVGVAFNPVTYHEAIAPQQVTARGTIFNAFGAEAAWRVADWLQLSGQYRFNGYPLTRIQPTADRRVEHHGDLTAFVVWPLLPHLELATGLGGQWTGYDVSAGPPVERPEDLYDSGYQRWLGHADALIGWRPWPDRPFTVTAGLQAVPVGQGFRLGGGDALRLWGLGWTAGARYSLGGFALEATYRGQRLFGDGYGQSADQLHTGIAYYFR